MTPLVALSVAADTPLSKQLQDLMRKRGEAVHRGGLFSLKVRTLNREIGKLRDQQVGQKASASVSVMLIKLPISPHCDLLHLHGEAYFRLRSHPKEHNLITEQIGAQ